ncbi:MAG: type IIL restriction-modification enzyme MmeI, partial [Nanoarchaeota archaeon]
MDIPLFNDKTIKRLSADIQLNSQKIKAAKDWIERLEKNQLKAEKSNYPKFMQIILNQILEYPILDLDYEAENVEFSFKKNGKTNIIIEAKGTETQNLFTKQNRVNPESPSEQLWRYMNHHATPYGIVTNYKDFILFKHSLGNRTYHIFDFLSIKNDIDKLKEFIALFSRKSIDEEFVEKVYQKSIVEEKEITDNFYKLFHETRLMMIEEFKSYGTTELESIHYAQLYLNRLMFVFFAEDTNKLQSKLFENLIVETLKNPLIVSDKSNLISNIICDLFRRLNEGSTNPIKIFGFNGGLFGKEIPSKIFFRDLRNREYFKGLYLDSRLKKEIKLDQITQRVLDKYKGEINPIIYNLLYMASCDFNSEINV